MSSTIVDGERHYFGAATANQSTSDARLAFLKTATGKTTGSMADLEAAYFQSLSTLTNPTTHSTTDHELKYLQTNLVSTSTDLTFLRKQKYV